MHTKIVFSRGFAPEPFGGTYMTTLLRLSS